VRQPVVQRALALLGKHATGLRTLGSFLVMDKYD
jgi:hypothetical protein